MKSKNQSKYSKLNQPRENEKAICLSLSKAKAESNLSLREIAEMTGFTMTKLNNILNHNVSYTVAIDDIVTLCKVFKVSFLVNEHGIGGVE